MNRVIVGKLDDIFLCNWWTLDLELSWRMLEIARVSEFVVWEKKTWGLKYLWTCRLSLRGNTVVEDDRMLSWSIVREHDLLSSVEKTRCRCFLVIMNKTQESSTAEEITQSKSIILVKSGVWKEIYQMLHVRLELTLPQLNKSWVKRKVRLSRFFAIASQCYSSDFLHVSKS